MTPPELAADAPVLDVAHPLEIGAVPVLGHEIGCARPRRRESRAPRAFRRVTYHWSVSQGSTTAPLRSPRGIVSRCGFDLLEQARGLEVRDDALARLEAVEPAIGGRRLVADPRVSREDVEERQAAALADLVVVEVVRGRQLHATRAESRVGKRIRDERDLAAGERQREHRPIESRGSAHRPDGMRPRRRPASSRAAWSRRSRDPFHSRTGSGCATAIRSLPRTGPRGRKRPSSAPGPS